MWGDETEVVFGKSIQALWQIRTLLTVVHEGALAQRLARKLGALRRSHHGKLVGPDVQEFIVSLSLMSLCYGTPGF